MSIVDKLLNRNKEILDNLNTDTPKDDMLKAQLRGKDTVIEPKPIEEIKPIVKERITKKTWTTITIEKDLLNRVNELRGAQTTNEFIKLLLNNYRL